MSATTEARNHYERLAAQASGTLARDAEPPRVSSLEWQAFYSDPLRSNEEVPSVR